MKRSELVVGNVYLCRVSGLKVLVNKTEDAKTSSGADTLLVYGRYFNVVTGQYDSINIVDGQLLDIGCNDKIVSG